MQPATKAGWWQGKLAVSTRKGMGKRETLGVVTGPTWQWHNCTCSYCTGNNRVEACGRQTNQRLLGYSFLFAWILGNNTHLLNYIMHK